MSRKKGTQNVDYVLVNAKCFPMFEKHCKIEGKHIKIDRKLISKLTGFAEYIVAESARRWRGKQEQENQDNNMKELEERLILENARLKSLLKEHQTKNTLWDIIGEKVIGEVKSLPDVPDKRLLKRKASQKKKPEEIFLLLSDIHYGSIVDVRESGGIGSYNTEIFKERLDHLLESFFSICSIQLSAIHSPAINICLLGDICDGAGIFPGHQRQVEVHAAKQVVQVAEHLAQFIGKIAEFYDWDVNTYSVVGNHGRVGKKGEESPLNNFDFLAYHIMDLRLRNVKNVNFVNSESWFLPVERMGKKFHLHHGDNIRSWMNIPFYGIERAESRTQKMYKVSGGQSFDFFLLGHFHQAAIIGNTVVNGGFPGGSEFSIKTLQIAGIPAQVSFGLHEERGITWRREILLDKNQGRNLIEFHS